MTIYSSGSDVFVLDSAVYEPRTFSESGPSLIEGKSVLQLLYLLFIVILLPNMLLMASAFRCNNCHCCEMLRVVLRGQERRGLFANSRQETDTAQPTEFLPAGLR